MTSLTVYDGATGIGGNKLYLEEGGKGVLLDFGKNFGKYGIFYEEFLKNRDTRGIHDLINLGLLPKLNIYRDDLFPSDLSTNDFNPLAVSAVLLTHAHMDHCGNIGALRMDIPIVASPETLVIMKGMQDTTNASIETDTTYSSLREPEGEGGFYLGSNSKEYLGRNFLCTEPPTNELKEFIRSSSKAKKKLVSGSCTFYEDFEFPFEITAYPVDHSIFGATAYVFRGETSIAYTGDFRLHGKQGQSTRDFVYEASDVSVLITEGTRAKSKEDEEEAENTSEQLVCETCRESVEESSGLVIADFSPRNLERLETFEEIAQQTNRELVVTAKDAYLLHVLACADAVCRTESILIYDEIKGKTKRKWVSH